MSQKKTRSSDIYRYRQKEKKWRYSHERIDIEFVLCLETSSCRTIHWSASSLWGLGLVLVFNLHSPNSQPCIIPSYKPTNQASYEPHPPSVRHTSSFWEGRAKKKKKKKKRKKKAKVKTFWTERRTGMTLDR